LHTGDCMSGTLPMDQTPENVFDHFAAEILEKSLYEICNFLLQTTLMPHMTANMAGELTDTAAEDILETLYRKNFFLEKRRLPVVNCQCHSLFRQFSLRWAARTFRADTLQTIRCHPTEILKKHELPEEAIRTFGVSISIMTMPTTYDDIITYRRHAPNSIQL